MSRPEVSTSRRRLLALTAAAGLAAALGAVSAAAPALAAPTTVYASPTGTGTSCSSAQPCSLAGAQAAVRSLNDAMSDDIVVQLADGTYRLPAPLRLTAEDSGSNGHTVVWQAAPSAHPAISGARAVTGWTQADAGRNIWRADVGAGTDTRQLYVNGAVATRARTAVNRSDFTATSSGLRFGNSALNYLNNLADQGRIQMESIGSFTDRYVSVQSISGNFITMQQPGWNNNTFGYDTFTSPHRAGPLYLSNAYEFLDAPGEWYLNRGTGALYYIPAAGQNMSTADVELPVLQSLVDVGGTYDAPAHDVTFTGITFTGTSWLGPSSNQGYADQQTGAYVTGNWNWPALTACQEGCTQFEATRPNWSQMPAAVQVSAAHHITFSGAQFVNLGQMAIGIGNDANAHASGVGLGAGDITVTGSEIARSTAGGIVVGGVRADAHHPGDSRMVNRNITISNNRIHDLGLEHRGNVSVLTTYVSTATLSHNEVYNMPYSGMSVGFGWGANEPGGSTQYANRGLYNYQPRYTTATTAANNRVIGNYIHDVMQQTTDGGCIYTLSWNPGALINGNYCLRTNGWFGLYFDEGSKYYTATGNVFSAIGTWATANYWGGENMGNFTVTGNWASSSATNVTNGDRGNVVNNNVTVTNGNWPSGAQAVMASAGPQGGSSPPGKQIVGVQSGRCVDVAGGATANGTATQLWDCTGATNQTWTYTSGRQLTTYGGTKCLDANGQGTSNGTAVIIWDCNGQPNQQWNVNSNGTVTGQQSGLCLDVTGASTANGAKLNLWTCHGGTNQQWTLR
ncbi:ricin-type beta-trefoil lectin domain protein [Actinoplanes oblitus]|uniref:Ricin-type beta-trefoil lectin domain protein n=1 Tax=Actinoplanes oblitus TaxID=3040509 RepID=A0ABY8WC28_9ACTN|nr:ricin-type beta-trefoil lectin domain protein [Actinoplanes oblitus]WIM94497.1 ricin-type beta-trefoil lectin domain protein [Actinoplanes oblitus]